MSLKLHENLTKAAPRLHTSILILIDYNNKKANIEQKTASDNILVNFLRFEKTDILLLNTWTQAK